MGLYYTDIQGHFPRIILSIYGQIFYYNVYQNGIFQSIKLKMEIKK